MTALSVNLNKVALVRNSRPHNSPDLLEFAQIALDQGVQGLTIHPRPDQRHIRGSDVMPLSMLCQKGGVEFNMEGNPFSEPNADGATFLDLVSEANPTQCTLVPDSTDQLTSDHGWDLRDESCLSDLIPVIERLQEAGIRVSLFLDPDPEMIPGVLRTGAERIELYTEPYARAFELGEKEAELCLRAYRDVAFLAIEQGVGINAGHDLTAENLPLFLKTVPSVLEVSIGHALTVDALKKGFDQAVQAYLGICSSEFGADS